MPCFSHASVIGFCSRRSNKFPQSQLLQPVLDVGRTVSEAVRGFQTAVIDKGGSSDFGDQLFLAVGFSAEEGGLFKSIQAALVACGVNQLMANAKEKGRRIGRPQTTKDDIPAVFYKHYPSFASGQMNVSELARVCGLSRPTVYKYLKMVA